MGTGPGKHWWLVLRSAFEVGLKNFSSVLVLWEQARDAESDLSVKMSLLGASR